MIIKSDAQHIPLFDNSVHCVVTSPPYWGLRDYGTASWQGGDEDCDHLAPNRGGRNPATSSKQLTNGGTLVYQFDAQCAKCGATRIDKQIGLEKTPEEYVAKIVAVFREVRRVLRDDGTVWCNLGDSYAGGGFAGSEKAFSGKQGTNGGSLNMIGRPLNHGLKPKDLVGIPWRCAFALQADGWWLRSDIIWSKPNPMPESVTDRPTKAHEYIFLLAKSERYYFDQDAVREPLTEASIQRDKNPRGRKQNGGGSWESMSGINYTTDLGDMKCNNAGRNIRTVWEMVTQPYPEAHFATFPEELAKRCILAGTSERGCCVKCGSPWERVVEKSGGTIGYSWHDHKNDLAQGQRTDASSLKAADYGNGKYQIKQLGWQPTCKCGVTETKACIVLDPFAGSGTTVQVAQDLGRIGIGLDLKPDYIQLARRRSAQQGFIFA